MGLVVYDFYNRCDPFTEEMKGWLASGAVKPLEDKVAGLSAAPAHFERLMRGENIGKAVVVI
jgi:NADPH-dependent curcumin reductase CurA